jgi:hypothetical protein
VILKLECLFYQSIYILYLILFYIRRAISTQTNPKKGLIEKKPTIFECFFCPSNLSLENFTFFSPADSHVFIKPSVYRFLLISGHSNLNIKYLKALNSASSRFKTSNTNRFDNDSTTSATNLTNHFTNTSDTLATGLESARTYNSKLPGLNRRISG